MRKEGSRVKPKRRRDSQAVRLADELHALVELACAQRRIKVGRKVTMNSLVEEYVWQGLLRDKVVTSVPKDADGTAKPESQRISTTR